jgi:hypothetical protein
LINYTEQIVERRSRPLDAIRGDEKEVFPSSEVASSSMIIHKRSDPEDEYSFTLDEITSSVFVLLVLFLVVSMLRKGSFSSRKGIQRIKSKNFWIIFGVTSFVFIFFKMGFFAKVCT